MFLDKLEVEMLKEENEFLEKMIKSLEESGDTVCPHTVKAFVGSNPYGGNNQLLVD
ncbi:MAG: hypothetical protein GY679_01440 [Mycoplasma sp.]|nr:hypothetical protein [Mycoplasma sp.]